MQNRIEAEPNSNLVIPQQTHKHMPDVPTETLNTKYPTTVAQPGNWTAVESRTPSRKNTINQPTFS